MAGRRQRASERVRALVVAGAVVAATVVAVDVGVPFAAAQTAVNYYVSTTGSDSTGDGSSAKPWASIQKARDSVRGQLAGMSSDINVNIAPGDYHQSSTVNFTDADSGRNGFDVVYRSSGGLGSARVIGGQKVTGWSLHQGGIYRADIGAGKSLNTLYADGSRARLARFPNYRHDKAFPTAHAAYLESVGTTSSYTEFNYNATDLAGISWSNLSGAGVNIWSGGSWDWFTDKTPITSVDATNSVIKLSESVRYPIKSGSRYYVQGMLELLDAPNEYFYDSGSGYLYYYPESGDINSTTVIVPAVQKLISVTGASASARAHHITFDGLTLGFTDFTRWNRHGWVNAGDSGEGHTHSQYDRQVNLPQNRTGMVFLENTNDITITNSHLTNSGFSAVFMLFANSNNTVSNNLIDHVGHSGVFLEGRYPGEGDVLTQNTVHNNMIKYIGELVGHGGGVYVMNSSRNTITNLEISHSPRYAVVINAIKDLPQADMYAQGNLVKGVRVHNATEDSGDTGPLYSFGLSDDKPYLYNSWEQITVNGARAHPSMHDYAPFGVYMDNDSYGQHFTNVQLSDTQGVAFHNNESGDHVTSNVSWETGFTESKMDYNGIGVTSSFPYPGGDDFVGDFRNGLANWSTGKGAPVTSTEQRHGTATSYKQTGETSVIYKTFPRKQEKRVSVWLYDDATKTSMDAMARVDAGGWDGATWRGLGVKASTSSTHYSYRVDGTVTATTIPRSTGWHEFAWDYGSGNGVRMYVDGKLVASPTGLGAFDQIAMGDWWVGTTGTAYWADAVVARFAEGFEGGAGAFTAGKGGVSTSTTRAKDGSASYVADTDEDVAVTTLEGKQYKVASVWFHDDAADTSLAQMARVDDGGWSDSGSWRGLGVNTGVSTSNYVIRVGATTTATSVPRTTGWHKLTWDYRSGSGVQMRIDGVLVGSPGGTRQFNMIALGDWWADKMTGAVNWDHVTVSGK
ncbi:hypothetical protein F4560_003151 [Saccharothrix ecbatanensis]|uniref:Right handed beta helix domain-containing protein n=1 Tax=Saccharothrix ecbatanensis TaxID=1105145 RepID=A0A7W9M107_9PSEU|nr:right-handed parallel beta-helix repeat-containing protein [Saccharothrix ecbatanensis]MBB5803383.1 hypothetical protein [Saccharothrix ecbatanensis]